MALVVLCFSVLLEVRPDQRVALCFFPSYPLPETCASRSIFGITCPGCGLTRSIIHLAHGGWHASLQSHRLGWLMAAVILFQFPYRITALWRGDCSPVTQCLFRRAGYLLIVLLVGNWVRDIVLPG